MPHREFDCYDSTDIDAFRAGRWRYVTITVTVECPGVDIADQLGAVEYGTVANTTIDVDQLLDDYPVPDMIGTCRHLLADLRNRLDALAVAEPDILTLRMSTAQAHTVHHALQLTHNHWAQAASTAEVAAEQPQRPTRPATPGTINIEPTPSGYQGIALIARGEQATYRKLADRLHTLIEGAETP